ncbi:BREX-1 system adenine-specific DNA-methyltransferase PglX [Natronincola ferrireducens]|uniref:site-specific DNA-methyltransferase (adenine-specific) n=1 Tax=Natronincola ferrireducens TaxID=393762 RepID=A0A1G8YWW2_9FIRM|nr:BREX-1 system adenine-specific DNA-methyltransferase PglX [Natronincola ferrireducens]SDK06904.1 Methyltransferase domain-containing protein [Natronincola ferrireducens]
MNKTLLKNLVLQGRRELRHKIKRRAMDLGITEENIHGKPRIHLTVREEVERNKLLAKMLAKGFLEVIEEATYTWFKVLIILRFMEANDYYPIHIKSLAYPIGSNIEKEHILRQWNKLNEIAPWIFQAIQEDDLLLFPTNLLKEGSFLGELTNKHLISQEDWQEVEIIGWLYQYYITEENERISKGKGRYEKEEISFATQLFTPKWMVQYMIENSLGRYWVESHPKDKELIEGWKYYVENPGLQKDFQEKLIIDINESSRIEEIKCFDPAMGSGHILVYMFDVLFQIYKRYGYKHKEIPRLIIENNLYGLDIDDRAYELACFSIVMKAMAYDRDFLESIKKEGLKLHLAAIEETNDLEEGDIAYVAGGCRGENYKKTKKFIGQFYDGKLYGSLIEVKEFDREFFENRLKDIKNNSPQNSSEKILKKKMIKVLSSLIMQAEIMGKSYEILVTNPPYISNKYFPPKLSNFIINNYHEVKDDLFSAFIVYSFSRVKPHGHLAFMTPFVWMFIGSYEKLREMIIKKKQITSLVQLEYSGFDGATVPICVFTLRNQYINLPGEYIRLSEFRGVENQSIKTREAIINPEVDYRYTIYAKKFLKINKIPIAYWLSEKLSNIFLMEKPISSYGRTCKGIDTGNNSLFLKLWFEIEFQKLGVGFKNYKQAMESSFDYYPYNKGGAYRKWYGNHEYVLWWKKDGKDLKKYPKANLRNKEYYRRDGLTWSTVTSSSFSMREFGYGFYFDNGGSCLFIENKRYYLALLNSKIFKSIQKLSPTLNFQPGDIGRVPVIFSESRKDKIIDLTGECIAIAKKDWDSLEISWDFKQDPILAHKEKATTIEEAFDNWKIFSEAQFNKLKKKEEEINRLFIEIYGLGEELTPEVNEEDITIRRADGKRDIKAFISYSVGCMLGRYSLDEEGLVYAGGEFDIKRYNKFRPVEDNILPILSNKHLGDDIVSRFIEFIKVTFGEDTLQENIEYIAVVLGRQKGRTAEEVIRSYFLHDFYKDHVKTYKKRPIYWLFTSGKEKAFNCLIYIHRYDKQIFKKLREDYLPRLHKNLKAQKIVLTAVVNQSGTVKNNSSVKKEFKRLKKEIEELKIYDEMLHPMVQEEIEVDLDDGVTVNYGKFNNLLKNL